MKKILVFTLSLMLFGMPLANAEQDLKEQIKAVLKAHPELVIDVVKENPLKFMRALGQASRDAKQRLAQQQQVTEEERFKNAFKNPLKPVIRKDEIIRGKKGAPLILVEYSDFECPFCIRGYKTVSQLLKKYDGKIQFVYKHLPLSFHKNALISSKYYEALRLQDEKLAIKLHDEIFNNQNALKQGGEVFLLASAKKIGANIKQLTSDLKNKAAIINKRIQEDQAEAARFKFNGTPGFLLNGIPVRGAYPIQHFERIINTLKQKGMLKL